MKLGVVIVAYHSQERLYKYIECELPKLKEFVCVIVNNASTLEESHKLADMLGAKLVESDEANLPDSKLFLLNAIDNLGYARGNNLGAEFLIENFNVDYLLFSNDDIEIISPNIFESIINILKKEKNIGAIGPRIISRDGFDQSPHRKSLSIYRKIAWNILPFLRKKCSNTVVKKYIPESGECYWCSGAFFFMKSDAFLQCKGFDPETFLYYEEVILAERMKQKGLKFYFCNDVRVLHYEGASTPPSIEKQKIMWESEYIYYRKYMGVSTIIFLLYQLSIWLNRVIYR